MRRLHEKGKRRSCPQLSQRRRIKPLAKIPQSKKDRNSCSTKRGTGRSRSSLPAEERLQFLGKHLIQHCGFGMARCILQGGVPHVPAAMHAWHRSRSERLKALRSDVAKKSEICATIGPFFSEVLPISTTWNVRERLPLNREQAPEQRLTRNVASFGAASWNVVAGFSPALARVPMPNGASISTTSSAAFRCFSPDHLG